MQADLIEPAVKGTQNLLSSVTKFKSTVKKVVLTSSLAGETGFPVTSAAHQGENQGKYLGMQDLDSDQCIYMSWTHNYCIAPLFQGIHLTVVIPSISG